MDNKYEDFNDDELLRIASERQGVPEIFRDREEIINFLNSDDIYIEKEIVIKLLDADFKLMSTTRKNPSSIFITRNDFDNPEVYAESLLKYRFINGNVFSPIEMIPYYFVVTKKSVEFVTRIMNVYGFYFNKVSVDELYNLLWYITVGKDPFASLLTNEEINYISVVDIPDLLRILGPRYEGPKDRASLLFAIISGTSTSSPNADTIPQYDRVKGYRPLQVLMFATYKYQLKRDDILPPYVVVALNQYDMLEQIYMNMDESNYLQYADNLGIVLQKIGIGMDLASMWNDLASYGPVLNRGDNFPPPPITFNGLTEEQIENLVSHYTTRELIDAYEITEYRPRNFIITQIVKWAVNRHWSFRNKMCNNDDTFNIITGEKHGEINKDDIDDPTLSYGLIGNYRCYQVSELIAYFAQVPGVFPVPDYIIGTIDPTTERPMEKLFNIESIKYLFNLIQRYFTQNKYSRILGDLLGVLEEGIYNYKDLTISILKQRYNEMNPEQKIFIQIYLVWLFMYGMWMRFWKGPGFPWPTINVRIFDAQDREEKQRCSMEDRDEHVFIQQSIRSVFIENYEKDSFLLDWIDTMPQINYNFVNGDTVVTDKKIKIILDSLMLGEQCMGFAADYIIETAYVMLTNVLLLDTDEKFNNFINKIIPAVLDIERQVVERDIMTIVDPDKNMHYYQDSVLRNHENFNLSINAIRHRLNILRERKEALGTVAKPLPTPIQPPFDPTKIAPNVHT